MDFSEDSYKRKYYYNPGHEHYFDDEHYCRRRSKRDIMYAVAAKIRSNRKLRILVFFSLLIIITIVTGLLILLIPVLSRVIDYLAHNGIEGIIEKVNGLINTILRGSTDKSAVQI